jgi:hypothetical protein
MRQEKVSVGIVMNVENEELSTWNRKVLGEGFRNIDEIRFPGTLRRERLERGDTEIQPIGSCCRHGK